MPCYHPIQGWRAKEVNSNGRRPLVFNPKDGFVDLPVKVPCGQCVGCRIDRSKAWAARCYHEASLHTQNCFINLTYRDQDLPYRSSLDKKDFQLFMKRLRKKYGSNIKVFYCGEYGSENSRPHFHAILFNLDFKDKKPWKRNKRGDMVYTSEALELLWCKGFCTLGAVTFQSAAYVARYIMKKVTGDPAAQHYERIDPVTGEIYQLTPEFCHSSRGIGKGWIERFMRDAYIAGKGEFIVVDNKKIRIPRYYDKIMDEDPEFFSALDKKLLKGKRIQQAKLHSDNNTSDRLRVRETVQQAKLALLKREV